MPQMTASMARRSSIRLARASGDRSAAAAGVGLCAVAGADWFPQSIASSPNPESAADTTHLRMPMMLLRVVPAPISGGSDTVLESLCRHHSTPLEKLEENC